MADKEKEEGEEYDESVSTVEEGKEIKEIVSNDIPSSRIDGGGGKSGKTSGVFDKGVRFKARGSQVESINKGASFLDQGSLNKKSFSSHTATHDLSKIDPNRTKLASQQYTSFISSTTGYSSTIPSTTKTRNSTSQRSRSNSEKKRSELLSAGSKLKEVDEVGSARKGKSRSNKKNKLGNDSQNKSSQNGTSRSRLKSDNSCSVMGTSELSKQNSQNDPNVEEASMLTSNVASVSKNRTNPKSKSTRDKKSRSTKSTSMSKTMPSKSNKSDSIKNRKSGY
ncbi:hypothetical protein RDWZM_006082 [Blomia tropicalis]|uniref:Uncharacterized protein n=1 Tax=Blomia tropicalis TaxID=40697 RepID=A0A9Q0RN77_BLOTA|nr:hypothetical protein BLOT_009240 [Blomia tropicalis]KAJ6220270.1 hypothetical protein RDWZM_006082 [Blomia tropicalis]